MSLAVRLAPFALEVFPEVETWNLGVNFRVAQLVTWKGTDRLELAPSVLCRLALTAIFEQLVGLIVKPGR